MLVIPMRGSISVVQIRLLAGLKEQGNISSLPLSLVIILHWKFVWKFYRDGKVSKEDLAATLRAHQSTVDAAKSRQEKKREAASAVKVTKAAADYKIAREDYQVSLYKYKDT